MKNKLFIFAMMLGLLAGLPAPAGQPDATNQPSSPKIPPPNQTASGHQPPAVHPGSLLVGFKPGIQTAARHTIHASVGAQRMHTFRYIPVEVVRLPKNADREEIMAAYRRQAGVAYVEPNYIHTKSTLPNDPRFNELWGLRNTGQTGGTPGADIAITGVWDTTTGSVDVLVAVIDTGIDYNHPDLTNNIWVNPSPTFGDLHGARWTGGYGAITSGDPMDGDGHGTHVAGTIGAMGNNDLGVAGVNWVVKMMGLKFLDDEGSGTTADAIAAIEYAIEKGAHLSNNSWGGGPYEQALKNAIDAAATAGQLFVAAAGNSATDNDAIPHYPSNYDSANILAVASSDHNDAPSWFTCYGCTSVDLAAPGSAILSTLPGSNYGVYSGTSMAAPHVAGVAALLLSLYPDASTDDLKNWLMQGTKKLPEWAGLTVTEGRMNAAETFRLAALATNILPVVEFSAAGVVGEATVNLSWTLPETSGLQQVIVRRGSDTYPADWNDGVAVYNGLATNFTDQTPTMGEWFYYSIWADYGSGVYAAVKYAYARSGGEPDDYFTEFFAQGGNDLANRSVLFVPNDSLNDYSAYSCTAYEFPSDPSDGTILDLGDDNYQMVSLASGASVSVYDTVASHIYVGANGYITFGTGDTNYTASLITHFSLPRISGLFYDLDPSEGGTISCKQFSDRVAVTYQNVPLWNVGGANSFQIEMFFDGKIRITWLALSADYGLVGLSAGEDLPLGFMNSDFSAYPEFLESVIRLGGELAFGRILAGQSATRTLTVHNDGNKPLTVSSISYPAGFSGNWDSGSIADGGSRNVTVTFTPTQFAVYGGTITVNSDADRGGNTLSCSGEGVGIEPPSTLNASAGEYTDRIRLQWNTGLDARTYRVWRSVTPAWSTAAVIIETGDLIYDDVTAVPGREYYYWITSRNIDVTSEPGPMATGWRRSKAANRNITSDFDGDGIMDPTVYQEATGAWLIMLSGRNHALATEYLGGPGWRPVPGDYDGDGITDLAVYASATGVWQARLSGSGRLVSASLGGPGYLPVPGDYDGDGRTDPAVYHELTGQWTALLSSSSYAPVSALLGSPGYLPVPADYDGDGRTDPAVYQLREMHAGWNIGYWAALLSEQNYNMTDGYFGDSPQIPVPADYNGNQRAAPATYRETDGQWSIGTSGAGPLVPNQILGGPGYLPVPGDYDGDGRADLVVYDEATGMWLAKLSALGYGVVSAMLGGPGYTPVGR